MKTLLICPEERPAVALLQQEAPLAAVPFLGQTLIEYWLSALASAGQQKVLVLASDRPDAVEEIVQDGSRWGLTAEVLRESRELTPAQAQLKHGRALDPVRPNDSIHVLDHFPGCREQPLFDSYAGWFQAVTAWMPKARTPDRVGVREIRPGVWVGIRARVSPRAELHAPCWIGNGALIGAGAIIGPDTIVEDGGFVEPMVELVRTVVGPNTFVGRFGRLVDSVAWTDTLIRWPTGSAAKVPDPFLLCALRRPRRSSGATWRDRLTELLARNKEEVSWVGKHLLVHKNTES
jgi:hypothetical protein